MCLYNPSKKHKATTDRLVYKCLDHWNVMENREEICTPYQYYPIAFDERGVCVLESKIGDVEWDLFAGKYRIKKGIHSYTSRHCAKKMASEFRRTKTTAHYAIIPKGNEYYTGDSHDAVAEKLIIFENEEVYKKYKEGTISLA